MKLNTQQAHVVLQAVNDKLFSTSWKISDYEKMPEMTGLNIVLRDLRQEREDLRFAKGELEKIAYL